MDWSDLFLHAVDPNTKNIVPVFEILNEIDAKYDFLKDYYSVSMQAILWPKMTILLQLQKSEL